MRKRELCLQYFVDGDGAKESVKSRLHASTTSANRGDERRGVKERAGKCLQL